MHDIVSLNWLFALDSFRTTADRLFPATYTRIEGVGYAAVAFKPYVYAPIVLLPALLVAGALAAVVAIRHRLGWELTRRAALRAMRLSDLE